jgi:hypothetical protein
MICESCGTEIKESDINLESGAKELIGHEVRNKIRFYSYLKHIYKSIRN